MVFYTFNNIYLTKTFLFTISAFDHFRFIESKHISNGKKQDFMYEKIKPNQLLKANN